MLADRPRPSPLASADHLEIEGLALRKALFLHTQKTAGTSIVAMAREKYGSDDVISHGDWLAEPLHAYKDKAFISGHFGFAFAAQFLPERYSFTFLRDPIDRIVSLYSFCRSRAPEEYPIYEIANKMSIDQFVEFGSQFSESDIPRFHCHSMIWNNQAWQLAHGWVYPKDAAKLGPTVMDYSEAQMLDLAKRNLERFDFVGFTDTFDADAVEISRSLGFGPSLQIPHENASVGTKRSALPRKTIAAISAVTQLDQEIYSFAKKLFRRRGRRFWHFRYGT